MKQELKGFSYITLSAVFFGSYGIWSRLMADSFGNYSQAWIRGLILLAILIPFGLYKKQLKKLHEKILSGLQL